MKATPRMITGAAAHLLAIGLSMWLGFLLRFEFDIPAEEVASLQIGLAAAIVLKSAVFHIAGMSKGGWRFVSISDLRRVFVANLAASGLVGAALLWMDIGFPRSVLITDFVLTFLITAGIRFAVRLVYESRGRSGGKSAKGLLIYGFDTPGVMLLREIRSNPALGYHVVGFLDDSPKAYGASVDGVTVLGQGRAAARIVAKRQNGRNRIDEIVVALPKVSRNTMQEVLANCRAAGVPCRTLPSLDEMLNHETLTKQIRDISVIDLLGREPVHLDESMIRDSVSGRSVLVTGAAGSIGAELCRQLAHFAPRKLVALDQNETGLHDMQLEMEKRFPDVPFVTCIADIRDLPRLEEVMLNYHIDSVFHAAAYKHVPLMEKHLFEALVNNVIGTYNLVVAARQSGAGSFLMISSDKAVNPTNVMGMTKRIAELIASSMPVPEGRDSTKFVSVRFGNVLGSNGSVVPLFRQQIAAGGPVTVTHPEMKRYFMTIPEAVQLVLQASTMSQGSEIFVLDMGEPVPIVELARNMIRLSGQEPDVDIPIRFSGLRPGEKLFEELALDGENIVPTYHEKIRIFRGETIPEAQMERWIETLKQLIAMRDTKHTLLHILDIVPEYQPEGEWAAILEQARMEPAPGPRRRAAAASSW